MAPTKTGRPFIYDTDDARPATVSLRMPHDLYAQVKRYIHLRGRMSLTEFLLDAARLKLDTPTDPRDLILSDDNTVIRELQAMVDAAVEAALAKRETPAQTCDAAPRPAVSYDSTTVVQPTPQRKIGRQPSPERQQILALLADHPEGLTAEQIRVYITAEKSLRHTLHGMKRGGVLTTQGQGQGLRYCAKSVPRLAHRQ